MNYAFLSLIVVLSIYFKFISNGVKKWSKLPLYDDQNGGFNSFSIIVPFRNEADNILKSLNALASQDYSNENYEIIFINDHSTDNSVSLLQSELNKFPNVRLLNLTEYEQGKKAAITGGVKEAKFENIITMDADCWVENQWLNSYNNYLINNNVKMIIGPVIMDGNSTIFSGFQQIDFLAMSSFGLICAAMGKPIIANGANLMIKKDVFMELGGYSGNEHIPTGDDVFMLHKIKKDYPQQIGVLKSQRAIVHTTTEQSFRSFFQQKLRWASKAKLYKDQFSIIASIGIFGMQCVTLLSLMGLIVFHGFLFEASKFFLVMKLLTDILFLLPFLSFYNKKRLWIYVLPLPVIYPIYIFVIAILAPFNDYTWKGRRISN